MKARRCCMLTTEETSDATDSMREPMIRRRCTIVRLAVLAVLTLGGDFAPQAAASALSPGQVVVAFGPELTGDPAVDFSRTVGTGDTVTVYLITGTLPLPTRHFSFGLWLSESQNMVLDEVRSFDFAQLHALQSDLGSIIRVAVNIYPTCVDLGPESVLAEVDLVRTGNEIPVQVHLGNFFYETTSPPEMESCHGVVRFFDDSMAQSLSVQAAVPTPIVRSGWGTIKTLYRQP